MLKKTYFLIAFTLMSIHAYSQEDIVGGSKSEEKVPITLVATQEVVFELRKNYGIKVSVELTKALWQVLHSYSNQQQAKIIWQSAISKVTTLDSSLSTVVNPHYNAGEVMITYVNGMSEKKWNGNRRFSVVNKEKLDDFLSMNDDLTIYFNLLPVWNLLLEDVDKQENINWQTVFQKSLKVFEQKELIEDSGDKKPLPLGESELHNEEGLGEVITIVTEFKAWTQSDNRTLDLSILMRKVDLVKDKGLSYALIRFVIAKDSEQLLSSTMSWFALAQQFIGKINSFSETELIFYQQFIEENDTWFLTKEQDLIAVDTRLPELVESSFHQLKPIVKDPQNITNVKLTSVYELLYPKIGKYMNSPFRKKIRKDLEVCLNISEEFAPYPQEPIDEKQFKGCVDDIYHAAVNEATSRELSGTLIKVENKQALDRALALPVWQTINILYANLASVECLKTTKQLPNPLEWTMAAESMLWFADRWPSYMDKFQQKDKIEDIISRGKVLVDGLDCTAGKADELLNSEFNHMVQSWKQVETDIQKVVEEFNAIFLRPGSDLNLIDDAQSKSNYRVEGAKIATCDVQNSCGVLVELEPSKALYNLFPKHLLMADQLKLGNVKLCYDDVGWEDRRAAPTHLDNNNVANYMGKFSFSLKGFYNDQLVFARKITDKQEYNYMFAANTQEVLNTYCPLSIVGDKISTKLERGTFGLVPNRLTFLTASRANETDVLVGNWASGEEWENAILSDDAKVLSEDNLDELQTDIVTAYQKKAKQLQDIIYRSILQQQEDASDVQEGLAASFATMQRHEKLLFSYNYLLQMDRLMQGDDLHGLFFGSNKVVDASTIRNYFDNQMNINVMQSEVEYNLKSNQEKWNALSNQVSNSHIRSLLYRLDSLYP